MGMPQAVDAYLETNNVSMVDRVKRNILELYEEDFRKIDPSGRAGMLVDAIPAELNKNSSRYQVSSVIAGEKEDRVGEIFADMQDSMTVYISCHADYPSAGMALHKDPRKYKLFLCDTGLFATLAFKDRDFTENIIYEKLLSGRLGTDLGYLYENMAAQILKTAGNELYYYTFPKETSNHNYEVDFLLARKNKIFGLQGACIAGCVSKKIFGSDFPEISGIYEGSEERWRYIMSAVLYDDVYITIRLYLQETFPYTLQR